MEDHDDQDEEDIHFCLKCKTKINGLENYVAHRREKCAIKEKRGTIVKPIPQLHNESDHNASHFFTSLELKSTACGAVESKITYKTTENNINCADIESDNSDGDNHPPKSHTGGKWEPGTRPDLTNEPTNFNGNFTLPFYDDRVAPNENLIAASEDPVAANEDPVLPEEPEEVVQNNNNENDEFTNSCGVCKLDFLEEKLLFLHQFSEEHKNKFVNLDEWSQDISLYQRKRLLGALPYQCHICSFYVTDIRDFSQHLLDRVHLRKTAQLRHPMLCLCCQFKCRSSDEMLSHMASREHKDTSKNSVHPIMILEKAFRFRCVFCRGRCSIDENKASMRECPHCQLTFDSRFLLQQHLTFHKLKSTRLSCSVCSQNFPTSFQLKSHFMKSHSENTSICTVCNRLFISVHDLKRHELTKHHRERTELPSVEKKTVLQCQHCRYSTTSKGEMCVHEAQHAGPIVMKRNHGLSKSRRFYECIFCSKLFTLSGLRIHVLRHTGERPYQCDICQKSFSQKGTLLTHMKSHISKRTNFKEKRDNSCCATCGTALHEKQKCLKETEQNECSLSDRNAEGKKAFLCDTCGHNARSLPVLKQHQRSHTGEKPFKCNHCNYRSSSSSNVLRHLRLHSGSKPYKCPYCAYLCNTQENIRKHILKTKKHAGKMVYPCKHCDYGCNEFSGFKNHMMEKHQDLVDGKDPANIISDLYMKDYPRNFQGKPNLMPENSPGKSRTQTNNGDSGKVVIPILLLAPKETNPPIVLVTQERPPPPPKKSAPTQYRPLLPKAPVAKKPTENPVFFTFANQNPTMNPQILTPGTSLEPPQRTALSSQIGSLSELVKATCSNKFVKSSSYEWEVPPKQRTLFQQRSGKKSALTRAVYRKILPNSKNLEKVKNVKTVNGAFSTRSSFNVSGSHLMNETPKISGDQSHFVTKSNQASNSLELINDLEKSNVTISSGVSNDKPGEHPSVFDANCDNEVIEDMATSEERFSNMEPIANATANICPVATDEDNSKLKMSFFDRQEVVVLEKEQSVTGEYSEYENSFFQVNISDENEANHSVVLLEMNDFIDEETGQLTKEALEAVSNIPTAVDGTSANLNDSENPEKTVYIYKGLSLCL